MKKNSFLFCLAIALALFSGCGFWDEEEEADEITAQGGQAQAAEAKVEIGYAAPDFEIGLLGGETVKLSDFRGKAAIVNFWATWSEPCVEEMPDFQRLSDAFGGDLAVIAINCGEEEEKVAEFIAQAGYTYSIGLDESGAAQKKYSPGALPYTVIISPGGTVVGIHIGSGGDMYPVYEKDIITALKQLGD